MMPWALFGVALVARDDATRPVLDRKDGAELKRCSGARSVHDHNVDPLKAQVPILKGKRKRQLRCACCIS